MREVGFKYLVGGVDGTWVFVRNRPKALSLGEEKDAEEKSEADAYLSVTDTFCKPPTDKPFVWFPWNEGRAPSPEMFYATNRVLLWWIEYEKRKTIQIFCDGGTHRSPTVFGAFLMTYFSEKAEDICARRVPVGQPDDYSRANPIEYMESYLREFPEDKLLFKVMSEDKLGRYDNHAAQMCLRIKNRYGANYFLEESDVKPPPLPNRQ